MPESTDAPPAIPAPLVRWLCCTLIGMREALVRSGRVRREALDACTANAERDYDARMAQQNRAAAASFEQMLANPLMFPLEAMKCAPGSGIGGPTP